MLYQDACLELKAHEMLDIIIFTNFYLYWSINVLTKINWNIKFLLKYVKPKDWLKNNSVQDNVW